MRSLQEKRDDFMHTDSEISDLFHAYMNDQIPDYQMAAWAMAVFFEV